MKNCILYQGHQHIHPQVLSSLPALVVTIGNFDGVHLGHQQIIRTAIQKAQAFGGQTLVYTFKPHPQVALNPERKVPLLMSSEEKHRVLSDLGVDIVVEEPFSREFSNLTPEQFFVDVILRKLHARAVVVGYDFSFGKGREGHLELLGKLCADNGVELSVVPPQRCNQSSASDVVSSSRVRQYLLNGDVERAAELLGRPYSYCGIVIRGEARARELGFPTANLRIGNKLVLPYGVYATEALFAGKLWASITNIGVRPTFHPEHLQNSLPEDSSVPPVLIETHLLQKAQGEGQAWDLYGSQLEVRFIRRIREERRFEGADALRAQVQLDIVQARRFLKLSDS